MVNDLLSDPCAYGQRKKSVDACLFAPNESPILRILGMNNRNKITFKMLHLTVDAWRLQSLQSFPQLTSHTCNRPVGFTQEAHDLKEGHDSPKKNGFLFLSYACAPAVRRPDCTIKTPWIWMICPPSVLEDGWRNTFFFFYSQNVTFCFPLR